MKHNKETKFLYSLSLKDQNNNELSFFLKLILFIYNLIQSQEIPTEFYDYNHLEDLFEKGKQWEQNTSLGSPRFQELNHYNSEMLDKDSLYINFRLGWHRLNESNALYGFGHFTYRKYLFGYLYPRIVDEGKYFRGFSGLPRDRKRGGFSSGETDISGIGFQNHWFYFQIGRGRESWGAGRNIELALSNNSNSYDYLMLGSDYGKLKVKYIHGFLESNNLGVNRYITAKGLEWNNGINFLVSLSEIIIYSGYNRPLDIAYLNPISSHLEVELNNRLNKAGSSNANAVWQLSSDYIYDKSLRFSGNLIYDEYVIDEVQKKAGKEHGIGFSTRVSYSPEIFRDRNVTMYISQVKVGTPTMRHGDGYNNFVQREDPLGWKYGSDGAEVRIGANINFLNNRLYSFFSTGNRKIGEESILERPYESYKDYTKGPFPSGIFSDIVFYSLKIKYWHKPYFLTYFSADINKNIINNNYEKVLVVGFDIYFPKKIVI